MFETDVAEVYDLIYRGRGKDFAAEAAELSTLVRARAPGARTLLDVACGTGEHLRYLRASFEQVAGLELAPSMRQRAAAKLPGVRIELGDMRTFALGTRFDAVTCLFSSVAYMTTTDELRLAVARMADHLTPGGVLVLEPWWFPERFVSGWVAGHAVQIDGRVASRVSRSVRKGGATLMESQYLLADEHGIRHFQQTELITLFTEAEYVEAVAAAGCEPEVLAGGHFDRGLIVGVRS